MNIPFIQRKKLRVLIACEYSGTVRDAFTEMGWDAWSCDLLPTESEGQHYQGDVTDILNQSWDLLIAHPPCRFLANSGVCHRHEEGQHLQIAEAINFFLLFKNCNIPHIAIENPIMHGYAKDFIGEETQIIQPYHFGHPENKSTCLWLKNLPPLYATADVEQQKKDLPKKDQNRIHYMSGKDRAKRRAKTFQGIANAMAQQWTDFLT